MTEQENNQQEKILIEDPHEKDNFKVDLENFQGPFDLLLHLIEEQKVEIYEVSIAKITSAYLEYLSKIKKLDLEIAGEFLIMAAALVEMKSRMLLPADEVSDEELLKELEAERVSLLERLVKYKMFKNLAKDLVDKEKEFGKVYSREKINEQIITVANEDREILLKEVELPDLLHAFAKVWGRAETIQQSKTGEIFDDKYTVREKMQEIAERLKKGNFRFVFYELFQGKFDKLEVITTFLAILEMVRQKFIRLIQSEVYGKIEIIGYDVLPKDLALVDEALNLEKAEQAKANQPAN
ncbi:segregation and condensation protein A [Candidatus Margulisiibacteriota bacterium]